MATKLKNNCLFFNMMHAMYNALPNMILLCKKDSIGISMTNFFISLLDPNLLSKKFLFNDVREALPQDKFDELKEVC